MSGHEQPSQHEQMGGAESEVKPESKVGLSLSFCIQDIALGKIKEGEVQKIITNTNAKTPQRWEDLLDHYKKTYWSKFPDEAEAIAQRLYNAGKIEQPRTMGGDVHRLEPGQHWQDAEPDTQTK